MKKNNLITWLIKHSFGLISNEKQALSFLLVLTVVALGFSFLISNKQPALPNDSPHQDWKAIK